MGYPSISTDDVSAESDMDYDDPGEDLPKGKNIITLRQNWKV